MGIYLIVRVLFSMEEKIAIGVKLPLNICFQCCISIINARPVPAESQNRILPFSWLIA